ncbi:MAG: hypothetical protein JWM64_1296 [Frankiales bacterium]|nr:hypothetical protein [Frankiales bacterium]
MALTPAQQEMLEFERRWPRHNGDKTRALREYFDLSVHEYDRLLARVLDLPSAAEYDSALVTEVKRQRRGQQWYARQLRQQGEWA